MQTPLVFNIQKFSVHDGPGIRTTIFFKGCPLSCQWCHNPESQRFHKELMIFHNRCTACGACVKKCPNGANQIVDGKLVFDRTKCTGCGVCTDWCVNEAREVAGKEYTVKELVKEAEKDREFYETSGGGITLSGGEVMCQNMDFIEELCRILYNKGYSIAIDTSGYAPYENFKRILPYVDMFLYDLKHMDADAHKKYIGVDNDLILENLKRLSADGARIFIRLPLIDGVNATTQMIEQVIAFLTENHIRVDQVNLLPYHNTGQHKYNKLDRPYNEDGLMKKPVDELMNQFMEFFIEKGFSNIKMGG